VLDVSAAEFDEVVGEALDGVPVELTEHMDNVALFVEDEPPADNPHLLGVYVGTPLTDRGWNYSGVLPDRIEIFRGPLLRMCRDRDELVEQVRITVVHEIAHHFGIGEQRLHDLGYG
jgi:predicted Zn-dependent protease with MMP-like domain